MAIELSPNRVEDILANAQKQTACLFGEKDIVVEATVSPPLALLEDISLFNSKSWSFPDIVATHHLHVLPCHIPSIVFNSSDSAAGVSHRYGLWGSVVQSEKSGGGRALRFTLHFFFLSFLSFRTTTWRIGRLLLPESRASASLSPSGFPLLTPLPAPSCAPDPPLLPRRWTSSSGGCRRPTTGAAFSRSCSTSLPTGPRPPFPPLTSTGLSLGLLHVVLTSFFEH